jgi:hypothetical protein
MFSFESWPGELEYIIGRIGRTETAKSLKVNPGIVEQWRQIPRIVERIDQLDSLVFPTTIDLAEKSRLIRQFHFAPQLPNQKNITNLYISLIPKYRKIRYYWMIDFVPEFIYPKDDPRHHHPEIHARAELTGWIKESWLNIMDTLKTYLSDDLYKAVGQSLSEMYYKRMGGTWIPQTGTSPFLASMYFENRDRPGSNEAPSITGERSTGYDEYWKFYGYAQNKRTNQEYKWEFDKVITEESFHVEPE